MLFEVVGNSVYWAITKFLPTAWTFEGTIGDLLIFRSIFPVDYSSLALFGKINTEYSQEIKQKTDTHVQEYAEADLGALISACSSDFPISTQWANFRFSLE